MEAINLCAFVALLGCAVLLASQVLHAGSVSMWNGFLAADSLSALVVLLTAFVALACSVYAVGYLREDEQNHVFEADVLGAVTISSLRKYYTLTPLFVFSMLLVALANNLGVMWVAIEATTLASVFLVSFYGQATSLEAAWKYAMIGGVGLSMALFGTILTYYSAHRVLETETLAGLNWSVLVTQCRAIRQDHHEPGVHPDSAGLRNQGGHCADAHLETRCLQRGARSSAAILSAAMLNCALYGLIRFYMLTSRAWAHSSRRSSSSFSGCCRSASRSRSCWCSETSGGFWRIPPSIMPAS